MKALHRSAVIFVLVLAGPWTLSIAQTDRFRQSADKESTEIKSEEPAAQTAPPRVTRPAPDSRTTVPRGGSTGSSPVDRFRHPDVTIKGTPGVEVRGPVIPRPVQIKLEILTGEGPDHAKVYGTERFVNAKTLDLPLTAVVHSLSTTEYQTEFWYFTKELSPSLDKPPSPSLGGTQLLYKSMSKMPTGAKAYEINYPFNPAAPPPAAAGKTFYVYAWPRQVSSTTSPPSENPYSGPASNPIKLIYAEAGKQAFHGPTTCTRAKDCDNGDGHCDTQGAEGSVGYCVTREMHARCHYDDDCAGGTKCFAHGGKGEKSCGTVIYTCKAEGAPFGTGGNTHYQVGNDGSKQDCGAYICKDGACLGKCWDDSECGYGHFCTEPDEPTLSLPGERRNICKKK